MADKPKSFDFSALVAAIRQVDEHMTAQTSRAVNISLTLRNWLIGCYIEEYERSGMDRAAYGERLMDELAKALQNHGLSRCDRRELYRYRQLYLTYPQIVEAVTPQFVPDSERFPIWQALSAKSDPTVLSGQIVESATPQLRVPGRKLIERLSFTHLSELIAIDDPLKRAFYEIECIRGNWSVRELKRQIGSLYHERSGLSIDKEELADLAQSGAEQTEPKLAIRDPYIFEFLGIKSREVMRESDLEDALLDKMQDFLLELGHGFCFEARQKRILIGNTHGFVDLVFYHRILKCHVLVELKIEAFTHENLGQLNTYVNWYRKNMMAESDTTRLSVFCSARKRAKPWSNTPLPVWTTSCSFPSTSWNCPARKRSSTSSKRR